MFEKFGGEIYPGGASARSLILLHLHQSSLMASENNDADSSAEQPVESPIIPFLQLRGSNKPVKTSWPELKGSTAQEAERTIKEQMPGVCIYMVKPDDFVTFDYRLDRVRLIVDSSGKVVETPALG